MTTDETQKSWADEVEDNDNLKTVVEYKVKDGKKYKITKKVRTVEKTTKVPKGVEERRKWKKFGLATGEKLNGDVQITCERGEDIFFEKTKGTISLVNVQNEENLRLERFKTQLFTAASVLAEIPGIKGETSGKAYRPPANRSEVSSPAPTDEPKKSTYVPPSARNAAGTTSTNMHDRDQSHTVRVSNLSDMITEQDLRNVFGKVGLLERVFLVTDRETRISKGFAFITYSTRAEAEKAIEKLNHLKWDHLILSVEWAKN
ncbi:eIF3-S4 [Acrasis kona]|uniref:Eukaryotic translation initiation factor 3 subunit G n=1 Tax=Acrasis kona TaxID=1008807 RepID=A0AAW2ZNN5_9EUKA